MLQRLIEQAVEIELGAQVDEDTAKADGGAVHEDEFARHADRSLLLQGAVHLEGLPATILGGRDAVGDRAHPVLEQRPIDEAGPDVEDVDQLVVESREAPGLIGADDAIAVIVQETAIELDDTADELRGEDADAAEVEKIETDGATVIVK